MAGPVGTSRKRCVCRRSRRRAWSRCPWGWRRRPSCRAGCSSTAVPRHVGPPGSRWLRGSASCCSRGGWTGAGLGLAGIVVGDPPYRQALQIGDLARCRAWPAVSCRKCQVLSHAQWSLIETMVERPTGWPQRETRHVAAVEDPGNGTKSRSPVLSSPTTPSSTSRCWCGPCVCPSRTSGPWRPAGLMRMKADRGVDRGRPRCSQPTPRDVRSRPPRGRPTAARVRGAAARRGRGSARLRALNGAGMEFACVGSCSDGTPQNRVSAGRSAVPRASRRTSAPSTLHEGPHR